MQKVGMMAMRVPCTSVRVAGRLVQDPILIKEYVYSGDLSRSPFAVVLSCLSNINGKGRCTHLLTPISFHSKERGDREGDTVFSRRIGRPPPLRRPCCRREGVGGRLAGRIHLLLVRFS